MYALCEEVRFNLVKKYKDEVRSFCGICNKIEPKGPYEDTGWYEADVVHFCKADEEDKGLVANFCPTCIITLKRLLHHTW